MHNRIKRRRFLKTFGGIFGILASPIVLAKEKEPKTLANWQPRLIYGKMTVSKDDITNIKNLLDESCNTMRLAQKKYIKDLEINCWAQK